MQGEKNQAFQNRFTIRDIFKCVIYNVSKKVTTFPHWLKRVSQSGRSKWGQSPPKSEKRSYLLSFTFQTRMTPYSTRHTAENFESGIFTAEFWQRIFFRASPSWNHMESPQWSKIENLTFWLFFFCACPIARDKMTNKLIKNVGCFCCCFVFFLKNNLKWCRIAA